MMKAAPRHRPGRPLRFLAGLGGGWIAFRIVMLWPQIDSVPALGDAVVPVVASVAPTPPVAVAPEPVAMPRQRIDGLPRTTPAPVAHPRRLPDPTRIALALAAFARFGPAEEVGPHQPAILPGLPRPVPLRDDARPSRWSGSAWAVARSGRGASSGIVGGQLGGSQAGMRLAYALNRQRRIAAAVRATSPLGPGLREFSAGLEWQPTLAPVRLVAEHRFAGGGGHGGPGVAVVGGAELTLPHRFRLAGYAQAGFIRRQATEAYADGAVQVTRDIATFGGVRFDLGAGAWGAAQRGAERIDIGPVVRVSATIGGQPLRLSLDWRERITGDARPMSGPAVTLGADF